MNQFANMTPEEFNTLVQTQVDKQLSSREEAEARRDAEEALSQAKETFESLKASIETKDAKIKEYEEALANLDTDPTAVEIAANEKIVGLEASTEEWKHRAEVAEAALETLAREDTATGRMGELEEAGVALDNEAAKAQYAKIRDMSEEDFESYKSELVALKSMYASPTAVEGEETTDKVIELSVDELNEIAQSLGCDPADSKCFSYIKEVAETMLKVTKNQKKADDAESASNASEDVEEPAADELESKTKEVASTLSIGDAIAGSIDQEIQANLDFKAECTQAWETSPDPKNGDK